LVLLFGLALFPSAALAHAKLVRSQPGANATVTEAPKLIELWFSEELQVSFSTIIVHDQNGKHVDKNDVTLSEGGKKLQISVEDLPSGKYTVEWKSLSTDGHTMMGQFGFAVALPASSTPAANTSPSPSAQRTPSAQPSASIPVESIQESGTGFSMSIVRWLEYLGMMILFGTFSFRLLVLAPSMLKATIDESATPLARNDRHFVQFAWLALLLIAITSIVGLIQETAAVQDTSLSLALAPSRMWQVISQTSYGGPWLLKMATLLSLAIVVLIILQRKKASARPLLWIGLGLMLLMFVAPSLMGHAAATKGWPLAVFSDWLHLVAVAFWVGGLFHLALTMKAVRTGLDDRQRIRLLHEIIPAFTRLAIASTIIIAVTGVYNSWIHVDRWSALWTTSYGKTLSIKVLLFIPMLMLGGLNTFVIHPRVKRVVAGGNEEKDGSAPKLNDAFRRSVAIEVVLGVAVLLAAAVLVFQQPAREHPGMAEDRKYHSMLTAESSESRTK
jgi:copper transport protein